MKWDFTHGTVRAATSRLIFMSLQTLCDDDSLHAYVGELVLSASLPQPPGQSLEQRNPGNPQAANRSRTVHCPSVKARSVVLEFKDFNLQHLHLNFFEMLIANRTSRGASWWED